MGEQNVEHTADEQTRRAFMKALLNEVRALEDMLNAGMIESGIRRIGAEQEMFLVDQSCRPALTAMKIFETIDDPRFTHELGLFNMEANLSPLELGEIACGSSSGRPTRCSISPARKRQDSAAGLRWSESCPP